MSALYKSFKGGFIDPLSLFGLGLLIVSLITGTVVVVNKGFNFDISKRAAIACPDGCFNDSYCATDEYCYKPATGCSSCKAKATTVTTNTTNTTNTTVQCPEICDINADCPSGKECYVKSNGCHDCRVIPTHPPSTLSPPATTCSKAFSGSCVDLNTYTCTTTHGQLDCGAGLTCGTGCSKKSTTPTCTSPNFCAPNTGYCSAGQVTGTCSSSGYVCCKASAQTPTPTPTPSNTCNGTYLSNKGCATNGCPAGQSAQEWRTVTCGTAIRCVSDSTCPSYVAECTVNQKRCNGDNSQICGSNGKWGISTSCCGRGCNSTTKECEPKPTTNLSTSIGSKKINGTACGSDSECQSGYCYAEAQKPAVYTYNSSYYASVLASTLRDTTQICQAFSLASETQISAAINTGGNYGALAGASIVGASSFYAVALPEIASLAAANGGVSAIPLAIYTYLTSAFSTAPAWVGPALTTASTLPALYSSTKCQLTNNCTEQDQAIMFMTAYGISHANEIQMGVNAFNQQNAQNEIQMGVNASNQQNAKQALDQYNTIQQNYLNTFGVNQHILTNEEYLLQRNIVGANGVPASESAADTQGLNIFYNQEYFNPRIQLHEQGHEIRYVTGQFQTLLDFVAPFSNDNPYAASLLAGSLEEIGNISSEVLPQLTSPYFQYSALEENAYLADNVQIYLDALKLIGKPEESTLFITNSYGEIIQVETINVDGTITSSTYMPSPNTNPTILGESNKLIKLLLP